MASRIVSFDKYLDDASSILLCMKSVLSPNSWTLGLICAMLYPASTFSQTVVQADQFVDSVGVNLHLTWNGTVYYNNFPLVQSQLIQLGVRHVRDGLVDTPWQGYYDHFNQLGQAGIHGTFISSVGQSATLLQTYPSRVSSSFEAFEAPNEYDISGNASWATSLRSFLPILYSSAKNTTGGKQFPVYGPSLVQSASYATLGNVSQYYDYGNLHNYPGGRNPGTLGWGANGYGSIAWNLQQITPFASGKPIATTETGYSNQTPTTDTVPQVISGRYMPRLLLEQNRSGIVRTFLFEMCDVSLPGITELYGLLNVDGSTKPAYTAVMNLLNLLSDPGPAFTPKTLHETVTGGTSDVHQLIFQKRDGSYYLALWIELPAYNVDAQQTISIPSQNVAVQVTDPVNLTDLYQWQDDGSVTHTAMTSSSQSAAITVSDKVTILRYQPGYVAVTVDSAPSNLAVGVDGTSVTTPHVFEWAAGTTHELDATLANAQPQSEQFFNSWSDGGPVTHTVTVTPASPTYTASYVTNYAVTTVVQPSAAGSIVTSPSSTTGFYAPSTNLSLTAHPNAGFAFSSWTGGASSANPTISLKPPATATANFTCLYSLSGPQQLSSAAGTFSVAVNSGAGCPYTAATSGSWITLNQTSGSGSSAVFAKFTANTTGTPRSANLVIAGQTIPITQSAPPVILVTITTSPAGLTVVVDGVSHTTPVVFRWYEGSLHGVGTNTSQQTSTTKYVFGKWTDGVATNDRTIDTPSTATTYTASFVAQ